MIVNEQAVVELIANTKGDHAHWSAIKHIPPVIGHVTCPDFRPGAIAVVCVIFAAVKMRIIKRVVGSLRTIKSSDAPVDCATSMQTWPRSGLASRSGRTNKWCFSSYRGNNSGLPNRWVYMLMAPVAYRHGSVCRCKPLESSAKLSDQPYSPIATEVARAA